MKIIGMKVRFVDNKAAQVRVYFFPKDESILDNLLNRRSRPQEEYRKLLPDVFKELNIRNTGPVRWSQKAGCSCGCSPGFIVGGLRGYDVFVKYE